MKVILLLVLSFVLATNSFGVVLFRYTDRLTGDERGINYSDKDGNSTVKNPDWLAREILEEDKPYYMDLHKQQIQGRKNQLRGNRELKKNKVRNKLKSLGFTEEEIEVIIN